MSEAGGAEDLPPRLFTFPSHQSHMVTLAKMCRDNKEFTDCVIRCVRPNAPEEDNDPATSTLRAHRLVLGSASKFLRRVFDETPASLAETTLVVPGVRPAVVEALLEFLYTGEMRVRRADTADLQLLIDTLQIDPELISIDEEGGEEDDDSESEEEGGGSVKDEDKTAKDEDQTAKEGESSKEEKEKTNEDQCEPEEVEAKGAQVKLEENRSRKRKNSDADSTESKRVKD